MATAITQEKIHDYDAEEIRAANDFASIIVLSLGKLAGGTPYYAYLMMCPGKYMEFKEAELKGNFSLNDFGTILKFGYESAPPQEVVEAMELEFGLKSGMLMEG